MRAPAIVAAILGVLVAAAACSQRVSSPIPSRRFIAAAVSQSPENAAGSHNGCAKTSALHTSSTAPATGTAARPRRAVFS